MCGSEMIGKIDESGGVIESGGVGDGQSKTGELKLIFKVLLESS